MDLSSNSNGSPILDPEIESIDQEIQQHIDDIRRLKTRRNTQVPIARLPPELISKIFMFCVPPDNDTLPYISSHRWSWITISQISRHWRDVALGCPVLWACLDFSKPGWVPEMLRRSKAVPLSVRVASEHRYYSKAAGAITATLQHMSRISELSLCIPSSNEDLERVLTGIREPAPLLHKLCLSSRGGSWPCERHVHLPLDFLNGDAPCLRHLELTDFHLSWTSGLLKNLTTLKVSSAHSVVAPTIQTLVEVLNRMPGLETLELREVLPSSKPTASVNPVQLINLESIALAADVAACANLLNYISFPSSTKMTFICFVLGDDDTLLEKCAPILPALSNIRRRWAESSGSIPPQGHSLSITTDDGFKMIESILPHPVGSLASSVPWLQLAFRFHAGTQKRKAELAAKVCEAIFPLRHVRFLSLNAYRNFFNTKILSKTLSSLSRVQMFHLQGTCAFDVFKALMLLKKNSERVAIFPLLVGLLLNHIDFDEYRAEDDELLDKLRDMLMLRSEAKAEILALSVKMCTRISMYDVALLREICTDVNWDEIEHFSEEEEEYDSEDDIYYGSDYDHPYGYGYGY